MTGVFGDIADAVLDVFGAPVTITPPQGEPVVVTALLRGASEAEATADGRTVWHHRGVLRMPPGTAAVPVGSTVTGDALPGAVFRLAHAMPSAAPGALVDYELELEDAP